MAQKFGLVSVSKTCPSGYVDGSWQDTYADKVKQTLYNKTVSLKNICSALGIPENSSNYEYFYYPTEGKAKIKPITNNLYKGSAYTISWKVKPSENKPSYEDLEKRVAELEKQVKKLLKK